MVVKVQKCRDTKHVSFTFLAYYLGGPHFGFSVQIISLKICLFLEFLCGFVILSMACVCCNRKSTRSDNTQHKFVIDGYSCINFTALLL
jgi:hypothetical protein